MTFVGFKFSGGSCCCREKIGFDEASWSWVTNTLSDAPVVTNLVASITEIDNCRLVFGGNNFTCGNAVRFPSGSWAKIKTWINSGGRLYIAAEHSGEKSGLLKCLQDMPNLNSFLTTIGSTIQYVGEDYNGSTPSISATYYSSGAASIASGISFSGGRFGEISGGTTLWLGPDGAPISGLGKTAAAIQKLGSGFVIVIGDSDVGALPGYANFLDRWYNWATGDIL